MALTLSRSGEEVGSYKIGNFGDVRLARVGALLFKRIQEKLTVCIKSLGGDRATEVAFSRFLSNDNVTTDIICSELAEQTNKACVGKSHVLCLQDTVQLTYPTQEAKKSEFGPTSDSDTKGLFVHPGVIVDASNRDVLGLSSAITWCRSNNAEKDKTQSKPMEEKESIRWIETALSAQQAISAPDMITVIGDRESDIFDMFQRVPNKKMQIITRASHDRNLLTGEKLSEHLAQVPVSGTNRISLPTITGVRKARTAVLEIKYTTLSLRNNDDEEVTLNCVAATEISPIKSGESPVSWVLLTTHKVTSLSSAKQILEWYTWRWIIEQIFRTMKSKGLRIEDSQVESPDKLKVLSVLSIATAIKIMCLVESRDGKNNRIASELFTKDEIKFLALICKKLSGKTEKQKNPYGEESMAWAAWVIARLGGWNGYPSSSPAGPITLLKGLQKFEMQHEGWLMAQ